MNWSKRCVIGHLAVLLILAGFVFGAPPAQAFHESIIGSAQVRTELCSGLVDVVDGDDVKSFNETATASDSAMEARATQSTTVSGTSVLAVTTKGEMNVTATELTSGCGDADSFMGAVAIGDDSEFDGEYFFTISGSLSFEGESDESSVHDGCLSFSVGGVVGESKCDLGESEGQTIMPVNESGFAEHPNLQVSAGAFLSGDSGFATATWDLTLRVFPPDSCPAAGPADIGGAASTSVPLAASVEESTVAAAAECTTPTVAFANDEGFDGGITEADGMSFLVTLSPAQATEVVVNFKVTFATDQEAVPGQDFEAAQGELRFLPGETLKTIPVTLMNDAIAEPDEAFGAVLTPSTAGGTPVTLGKSSVFAIIRDDDCAVHMPSASGPNDFTVPDGTVGAVCGSVFPDVIRGSQGPDTILGGAGDDVLIGGSGQDTLDGGLGNDKLFGGLALGTPFQQPGQDSSRDTLIGGPREFLSELGFLDKDDDEIFGEEGPDIIDGGIGNDELFGGNGNDDIAGGKGVDSIFGGTGNDTLYASDRPSPLVLANTALYLTEDTNDQLFGDAGNDVLHGSSGNNGLFGGPGNDTLYGHAGADSLLGEAGSDTLLEGPVFSADVATDILNGGNSTGDLDTCIATPVIDVKRNCEP